MATALTTHFDDRQQRYDELLDAATATLSAATAAVNEGKVNRTALVKTLAELDDDIAALRRDMSASNLLPSDIESQAETLRELLVQRRHKNAELLAENISLQLAESDKQAYDTLVKTYRALLTGAQSEATAAAARGAQHAVWLSGETETGIQELVTDAQALIAGASGPAPTGDELTEQEQRLVLIAEATARIEADVPGVLLAHARSRGTALVNDRLTAYDDQLDALQDQQVDYAESHGGEAGALQEQWLSYERLERRLRQAVLGSPRDFAKAEGMLQTVVDSTAPTAAESQRIQDVALAGDADALTNESALTGVHTAIRDKRLELELAKLSAQVADIDADPTDDSTVQTLQSELDTLLDTDLPAAEAALTAEMAEALDTWEAAVPDHIWVNLVTYDTAIALLSGIADLDLSALKTAFNDGEAALVAALDNADDSVRVNAVAAVAVERALAQRDFFVNNNYPHRLSAVKGDA